MKLKNLFCAAVLILLILPGCGREHESDIEKAFLSFRGRYVIVVEKSTFTLSVYDRGLNRVASYTVGYGMNPDGKAKLHEGDNRTPEGFYRVNEILSMDAAKGTPSYRKLKKMNMVYFSASGGHPKYGKPDKDLGDNVYGPRFYGIDYPSDSDKKRYAEALQRGIIPSVKSPASIGYGIAIHGNNDALSIGHMSSSGCLRMYNRDVVDLEKYITISTPVLIYGR